MDKVSVIIPAYNKADLTVKTVESVLNQTYKDIEVIVVDDGSTDDTKAKMSQFGSQIKYISKENGGACSARNLGIKNATGRYIGFLDCDDVYEPEKIEESIKYFNDNPQFGFIHTGAYFTDENFETVGQYSHAKSKKQGWISNRLIFGNYICNSTNLAKKECIDKAGFFDESFFMPADWDMWLRLSEICRVGYLDKPLTRYRVSENYIFDRLEKSREEEEIVVNKFFERNPKLIKPMRGKVISSLHLRYAQCYFLKDDRERLKEEFSQSLRNHPFNTKAWALLAYYLIARANLKSKLKKKILRCSES